MTRIWIALSLGLTMTCLLACGGDEEDEELPDADCSGEVPTYGEVTAFAKCTGCHSSALDEDARANAPADINFDMYAGAEAHATEAAEEVFEGEMPPAGSGMTLTAAEKEALYTWALCGAPE